jgi:hypothetical protein
MAKKSSLLGDYSIAKKNFSRSVKLDSKQSWQQQSDAVSKALLELIQEAPEPCFLLGAVLNFIEKVNLPHYTFSNFELWLNQFSGLSFEENYRIRAKIVGKWIERPDYQTLFPIGMGKVYEGTHFITAHKSPDLDTTIASFWGWVDAFAARVSDGLHIWNLPGGPPPSQIEIDWIFRDIFGNGIFTHLPKTHTSLSLSAMDLMTQKGMQRKTLSDSIAEIDHDRDQMAVVVVDDSGLYLGDWRNFDVESVRQVIILFSSCLRWFENAFQLDLISLFAREKLKFDDIAPFLRKRFGMKLHECEPALEFTTKQKKHVESFLSSVLGLKGGMNTDFETLGAHLCKMTQLPFTGLKELLEKLKREKLFDAKGKLLEERPRIFAYLERAFSRLHEAVVIIRARLEKLDIALKTKEQVFGHFPNYITTRSDVEEIKNRMESYLYLTVAVQDQKGLVPVGIVQSTDIRKNFLGTVSLRDFCNRDEMGIPSYLEVISVIDHHKTTLNTFTAPMAVISDAQSSNTLVAQKAFEINDQYSLGNQMPSQIEAQIKSPSTTTRQLQRLLSKRLVAQKKGNHFVHPDREFLEYLHFLYGILDDTDLLSKVSAIDIESVASLLNRMKSIAEGKETEIISLDDLPRDKNFAKKGAERILRHEDTYSLYRKVYEYREKEVEKNLLLSSKKQPSNIFADTKEQNGCCRVGQTKLFANNLAPFNRLANSVRQAWLDAAKAVNKQKPEIDLHIHMISTIVCAEEVYKGTLGKYSHQDEMWIWIPETEIGEAHLKRFLNSFQASPGLKGGDLEVEFLGSNADELSALFKESFGNVPQKKTKKDLPIAILRYKAGALNSRKAMVSPFLPTLSK